VKEKAEKVVKKMKELQKTGASISQYKGTIQSAAVI